MTRFGARNSVKRHYYYRGTVKSWGRFREINVGEVLTFLFWRSKTGKLCRFQVPRVSASLW